MSETRDHISVNIENLLLQLPSSPPKPTIFRVADNVNEKIYEPKIVSIGPFHHGKEHLQKMEQHKLMYLNCLMKRRKESTVNRYVVALRLQEEKARKCYSGTIDLNHDQLVKMLVLDGLFIIELIRKHALDELREKDDTIFQFLGQLRHDLMLVENQIPFFVLNQLFEMTKTVNPYDEIVYLVRLFSNGISLWPEPIEFIPDLSWKSADHLLDLVHKIWCTPFANLMANRPFKTKVDIITVVNSAMELQQSGVEFAKHIGSNCFDINFARGVLRIPTFIITDETEWILRNLMAYEHFCINNHPKCVTDYAFFLNRLVNSSKDVEILRRSGIVKNFLGNDEMVCHMFNRLGQNTLMSSDFCYADVFEKVKGHCSNKWVAILRRFLLCGCL